MNSRRRLRTGRTYAYGTAYSRCEEELSVGVHLFDVDTGKVRKQLLDGITRSDNDSSSDVHHTVRARTPNSRTKPVVLLDHRFKVVPCLVELFFDLLRGWFGVSRAGDAEYRHAGAEERSHPAAPCDHGAG